MKKRKFGIRTKFALFFIVFGIIIMCSVGLITYQSYKNAMMKKYASEAVTIAKLAASYLDGDEMVRYSISREKDAEYERLQAILDNIKEQSGVRFLYVVRPISDDSTVYLFDASSLDEKNPLAHLGQIGLWDDNFKLAKKAIATGEPSQELEPTWTDIGYLASAYVPVKNSAGQSVAVVGVDFSMDEILTFLKYSIKNLLFIMAGVILACFLLLLLLINHSIISPIRILKNRVERMSEGELGVQVPISSHDEIGEISEIFNRMSINISNHITEVTELNEGYYKFVPSVIFEILNKKSIKDIKLGDSRKVSLEVLSMQVNEFEEQTRRMEADELFHFVNRIYQLCVPVIIEKKGVVDSYFNGGLSAIFTELNTNALDSSITICQKLNEEKKMGKEPLLHEVDLAFGITKGNQMVGIVGHDKRLSEVTMSEQISIIEYLKKVAPKYNARILITGTAVNAISDFKERYHSRLLGLIHISASDSFEKIYDVYDGDEDIFKKVKEITKEKFEEGVNYFLLQQVSNARRCFVEVLKISPRDYAAREYLYLCNQYYTVEETSDIDIYIEDF